MTPGPSRNYREPVNDAYRNIVSFVAQGTNSGKTTVMERVIAEFARRGRTVTAVKHGLHMHYSDREGKDTHRFAQAGARRIVLFAPQGILMYEQSPPGVDYLASVASSGVDIVLVEGFKSGPFPKIEVFNDTLYPSPLCLEHPSGEYIALISNTPVSAGIRNFLFHETESLCTFIEEHAGLGKP